MLFAVDRHMQARSYSIERQCPDGQIDVKNPPPRKVVGKKSTEKRTNDARNSKYRAKVSLISPSFARRDDIPYRGENEGEKTPRAKPLDGAKDDELLDILCDPTEH